jgi:hypothetical protein
MVECNEVGYIQVAQSIAIGEAERFAEMTSDSGDAAARHRRFARVNQGHVPGLGILPMHFHVIIAQTERHI